MNSRLTRLLDYFFDGHIEKFKKLYNQFFQFDKTLIKKHLEKLSQGKVKIRQDYIGELTNNATLVEEFKNKAISLQNYNPNKEMKVQEFSDLFMDHNIISEHQSKNINDLKQLQDNLESRIKTINDAILENKKKQEFKEAIKKKNTIQKLKTIINQINTEIKATKDSLPHEKVNNLIKLLKDFLSKSKNLDFKRMNDIDDLQTAFEECKNSLQSINNRLNISTFKANKVVIIQNIYDNIRDCKTYIDFYQDYIDKNLKGLKLIHVKYYIFKLANRFKKNLSSKNSKRYDEKLQEISNQQIDFAKTNFFQRHRLPFILFVFYVFLFAIDGVYWGKIIISPLFEEMKISNAMVNVTLLDFLLSPSRNWLHTASILSVIGFHLISFFLVFILSRFPSRFAFYFKVLLQSKELKLENKNQSWVFRGVAPHTRLLAEKVFLGKIRLPFLPLRPLTIYYSILALYYVPLITIPFIYIDNPWMIFLNFIFWVLIHFIYKFFGEIDYVKEELGPWIDDYFLKFDDQLEKAEKDFGRDVAHYVRDDLDSIEYSLNDLFHIANHEEEELNGVYKDVLLLTEEKTRKSGELARLKEFYNTIQSEIQLYETQIEEIKLKISDIAPLENIRTINIKEVMDDIEIYINA